MISTVEDVTKFIGTVISRPPVCVETGCMYVIDEENLIHTTTNNILKNICLHDGTLFSLDIDPNHIEAARSIVGEERVYFVEGDSVETLKRFSVDFCPNTIDLLCLDSKEFDPWHMVKEYLAIEKVLKNNHFVFVDDIHNPNSVKWVEMVPLLKKRGYSYMEINTPTGLFVASKGYPLVTG